MCVNNLKKKILLSILGFLIFTCILADAFALQTSNVIQAAGTIKYRPIVIVAKDGSGNFTDIRSALDAWFEDALIYVKAGVYEENALDIPSGCHITGEEGTQVINSDDAIDTFRAWGTSDNWLSNIVLENFYIKGGRNAIFFSRVDSCTIRNVEVDSAAQGILFERSSNNLFENLYVHDSYSGFGLAVNGGSYNKIINCTVTRTARHSNIYIGTMPDTDSVGNEITDTTVTEAGVSTQSVGANGIYFADDWGVENRLGKCIRCTAENNWGSGFKLNPARDFTFEDCTARGNNLNQFAIATQFDQVATQNVTLRRCLAEGGGQAGFWVCSLNPTDPNVTFVKEVTFENCSAINNDENGWLISTYSSFIHVYRPKAQDNGAYGFWITNYVSDVDIHYYAQDLTGNTLGEFNVEAGAQRVTLEELTP